MARDQWGVAKMQHQRMAGAMGVLALLAALAACSGASGTAASSPPTSATSKKAPIATTCSAIFADGDPSLFKALADVARDASKTGSLTPADVDKAHTLDKRIRGVADQAKAPLADSVDGMADAWDKFVKTAGNQGNVDFSSFKASARVVADTCGPFIAEQANLG